MNCSLTTRSFWDFRETGRRPGSLRRLKERPWERELSSLHQKNEVCVSENSSLPFREFKFVFLRIQVCVSENSSLRFREFKFAFQRIQVCVSENSSLRLQIDLCELFLLRIDMNRPHLQYTTQYLLF